MKNQEKVLIIMLEFGLIIGGQWFLLSNLRTDGIWEWVISSVVLLGVAPILTIKYFFKETQSKYFITFKGESNGWIILMLITILFFGLVGLIVLKSGWWQFVPVSRWLLSQNLPLVIFMDFTLMPFVIFANEIFFRGLAMFSLAKWLGSLWGIIAQAILAVSYTAFFAKGFRLEKIFLLFILNLFLGYACLRKKSILASALIYWIVYVVLDTVVLHQIYQIK